MRLNSDKKRKNMKKIALLAFLLLVGCASKQETQNQLTSIQIIDRNGFNETISAEERLNRYTGIDFRSAQPYTKVVRQYASKASIMTSYHPNGELKQYLELKQGRAHGRYEEYFMNGQKKIETYVIEGIGDLSPEAQKSYLFDGISRVWDEEGNLTAEIPYDRGRMQGEASYYRAEGELMKSVSFKNGAVHGTVCEYLEDGTKLYEEIYEMDLLRSGTYPDGFVERGNGKRAVYQEGVLKALYTYVNGQPDGPVLEHSPQGELISTYVIKEGKKQGEEWIYYGKDRPKMSIEWNGDCMHGLVKTWYQEGVLESEKEMMNNARHGRSICWYRDGNL